MRRPRIAGGNARGHGNRFTPAAGRGGTERRRQGLYGDRRRWVSDRAARLSPCEENCAAAQPAMLFAHGGGWCLGSLALYDRPCQALANATGRVILSVDYRLAPEYPFPQPLEDVYQALCWVAQQAPQLGIDAQRPAVGGDSAGEIWRRRSRCWRGIAAARTSSASCCCTRRSAARWRRRAIASLPRGTF